MYSVIIFSCLIWPSWVQQQLKHDLKTDNAINLIWQLDFIKKCESIKLNINSEMIFPVVCLINQIQYVLTELSYH